MFRRFLTGFIFLIALSAEGYVIQMDRNSQGRIVTIQWPSGSARQGIPFVVNSSSFPFPENDVLRIVRKAFGDWDAVASSYLKFEDRGTGQFRPSNTDRQNVVFYDNSGRLIGAPPGTGVIAITRVNWDNRGEMTDADIIFNGRDFQFSIVENTTPRGRVDLQDVMTHEVGHLLGLDHTPLVGHPTVRPTMNPFNTAEMPREGRTLEQDDISGITALYPSAEARQLGSISGRVIHRSGSGAFGVNVVVYEAGSDRFLASAFSGSAGSGQRGRGGEGGYEIDGLPPGDYHVAIEPLDGSIRPQNFGGIFSRRFDRDFELEYFDNASLKQAAQIVRVDAGRVANKIDFVLGTAIIGAPFIQSPELPVNTPDPTGPYPVRARISDDKGVTSAELVYRINGGRLQTLPMGREGAFYAVQIPGQAVGSVVSYRIVAKDADGNETSMPAQDVPMLEFEVLRLSGSPLAYVAMRRSQVLSVIDTGPGREVARIPTGQTPLSVVMTPDERYLFVANTGTGGNADNRVTVVETATHRVVTTIQVGSAPLDMTVSRDGRWVFVTNSQSRSVSILDVAGLRENTVRIRVPTIGDGPYGVAVGPNGKRLYVTDIDGNQVFAFDVNTRMRIGEITDVVSSPRSLALSKDGKRLYVAGFDGDISVVDTESLSVIQTIDTGPSGVFRLALSPDDRRLYGTDQLNANLLVIDLESHRVTQTVPVLRSGRNTRDLFVSEDGTQIYVTNQDSNELVVFDTESLQVRRTFRFGDGPRGIVVKSRPFVTQVSAEHVTRSDFDGNGRVDFSDFVLFASRFGASMSDAAFEVRFDLDGDNRINFGDFLIFAGVFGQSVSGS
ncbi:MAG: beta-propeller fold lactonase family protein [bacterium]|nr:beta-propeller fold lactonase family protein [bacterium]